MKLREKKSFFIANCIKEIAAHDYLDKENFTYIFKINIPDEISINGKENVFKRSILSLISNSSRTYSNNLIVKIVLLTCKIENDQEFSISITSGGNWLSFIETKSIEKNIFLLRDNGEKLEICKINQIIKKEFKAYMKIISRKNKGRTIKCFFPLNQ